MYISVENLLGWRDSVALGLHSGLAPGESPRFGFLKRSPPEGLKNTKGHVKGIEIHIVPYEDRREIPKSRDYA
jgi:hypothetical protein